MTRAILDTSILIAGERERPLARPLPDQVALSVVTLAELEVGVLVAADDAVRSIRMQTLVGARERASGLAVDQRVASAYARLAAAALRSGRRPRIHDTWIAATALVHDAQVWTQDDDFSRFEDVAVVRV